VNRQEERNRAIARTAEVQAAVAFGVGVDAEIRSGDRTIEAVLARRAAVAVAKDLGLTWPEMVCAFSDIRGERQAISSLRQQRAEWRRAIDPERRSVWSEALAGIYSLILRGVRLRAETA